MDPFEITAACFGLLCVWLVIRQNIWCWPTGLVMVTLYIVIFYQARLYSDMGLQVVYIVLQVYGWWYWLRGGREAQPPPVTRLSRGGWLLWPAVALAGTAILGFTMHRYTDADLPYPDAATTVLSLIAQYLMARKILESWLAWIIVDVLAIGIYLAKELYPTAVLYAVFLVLATLGLIAWTRSIQARSATAAA